MVHQRNWIFVAVVVFTLIAFIPSAQAEPAAKADNPGLPGCLAKVNQLEQLIGALQEQINALQAQLDAMQNYAPVPQTGQTFSFAPGDDGDLQMGVLSPKPRFTNNANGTVTDNLTGFIWLTNANLGYTSWYDALTVCNTLADNGDTLKDGSMAGDWRLPNVRELQSLLDYSVNTPALPIGHPFTNNQSDYYWSSSTHSINTNAAWRVSFHDGTVRNDNKDIYPYYYYVWCVRGPIPFQE